MVALFPSTKGDSQGQKDWRTNMTKKPDFMSLAISKWSAASQTSGRGLQMILSSAALSASSELMQNPEADRYNSL
jgi:hypothetical protein